MSTWFVSRCSVKQLHHLPLVSLFIKKNWRWDEHPENEHKNKPLEKPGRPSFKRVESCRRENPPSATKGQLKPRRSVVFGVQITKISLTKKILMGSWGRFMKKGEKTTQKHVHDGIFLATFGEMLLFFGRQKWKDEPCHFVSFFFPGAMSLHHRSYIDTQEGVSYYDCIVGGPGVESCHQKPMVSKKKIHFFSRVDLAWANGVIR